MDKSRGYQQSLSPSLGKRLVLLGWLLWIPAIHARTRTYMEGQTYQDGMNIIIHVNRDTIHDVQRFGGREDVPDYFKLLYTEGSFMLLGARNMVYNVSMETLQEIKHIAWEADENRKKICEGSQKTTDQCQNYIKMIVKEDEQTYLMCGTNAFYPWCRKYRYQLDGTYFTMRDYRGTAIVPYDPDHNNTAIFAGGQLYTATVADNAGRNALIYREPMSTAQSHSEVLNSPQFVASVEYEDMVFFFFREVAVEHINCGKAVFSRVARVCKNDEGGAGRVLKNTFTSFFKARLNCSIPGDYPFYFDEIQSTSDLGKGNYMPSLIYQNRTDMVYAVFNTPRNGLSGSAICAFRFSDILKSFAGQFKAKKTPTSIWLPVKEEEVPEPHPAKSCFNDSKLLSDSTLNFVSNHPLMDEAVPAFGGMPILVQSNLNFRMTQVAVHWQVKAADQRYYDVLFIGTDDGRVIKAINKGRSNIETVIIEDIQVFTDKSPVVSLKVHIDEQEGQEKLIVVSRDEVKSILLHRCHLQKTCSGCVALQDPYCTWVDRRCANYKVGIQNVETGTHPSCPMDPSTFIPTEATSVPPTCPPCPACTQPTPAPADDKDLPDRRLTLSPSQGHDRTTQKGRNDIPQFPDDSKPEIGPCYGASTREEGTMYNSQTFAIAIILTMVLSLLVGFVGGMFAQRIRYKRNSREPTFSDHKAPPPSKPVYEKGTMPPVDNRWDKENISSSNNLNMHNTNIYQPAPQDTGFMVMPQQPPRLQEKQLNIVANALNPTSRRPNGSVDTKVLTPKGKTYL